MRNLFRSFERSGVDYLLISGQASVLYGAALFSEDIDIWLRPAADNITRFLRALASCRAAVHKLTPPMTVRNLRAGHGFHFIVPSGEGPVYLDVMGQPPRVGAFARARRRARIISCDWGAIPVVAIDDLVAIKKTRRLNDYEVITNLVRVRMAELEAPTREDFAWAASNAYRAEDRVRYLARLGKSRQVDAERRRIALDLAKEQQRDVAYWKRHTAELRRWRRTGKLWPAGAGVSSLTR